MLLSRAQSREMRALWALMYSTSIDVSTAIRLRRQDFEEARRGIQRRERRHTVAHSVTVRLRTLDAWAQPLESLRDIGFADVLQRYALRALFDGSCPTGSARPGTSSHADVADGVSHNPRTSPGRSTTLPAPSAGRA